MSKQQTFYRKKYLIAVYNENEECIGVYANRKEFAKAVHILNQRKDPIKYDTDHMLNRLWKGLRNNIYLAGQKCTVHFIELTPKEIENLE